MQVGGKTLFPHCYLHWKVFLFGQYKELRKVLYFLQQFIAGESSTFQTGHLSLIEISICDSLQEKVTYVGKCNFAVE